MPVYIVYSSAGRLTPALKADVAKAISETHRDLTGTPGFLAQVIFQEQQPGNVFLGGVPQGSENIFVQGMNRTGRSPELKRELTLKIVAAISSTASISTRSIWVYIDERPAGQMAEYGHILPEPGKESEWFERLPSDDRAFMESTASSRSTSN